MTTQEPRPKTTVEKSPLPVTLTLIYTDGRTETQQNIDARHAIPMMFTVKDVFGIMLTPYIRKEVDDGTKEQAS